MTNSQSLLNLDPDELLCKHSVEEVEGVARRLQREVDTKREELRVMVGERYRDLIEAADTIQTMKSSSLSVIQSVSEMQASSINLQKHSLTYTLPRYTEAGPAGLNLPYLRVAASIKLLMAVPERIWEAVENGKLTQGAELFLLAQHVHTGLQGDQGGGITPDRIKQWFPVISMQCATINNFYQGIIQSAKDQLMAVDLNTDQSLDALAALLLLKGLTADQILEDFLELRSECLRISRARGRSESARTSVCTYIQAVVSTVSTLHLLFTQESSLHQFIGKLCQESDPSISLLGKVCMGEMLRYLPEPVLHFKPRLSKPYQDVCKPALVSKTKCWLEKAQQEGEEECTSLLQDIHSLQGVAGVRQAIWCLLQQYQPYQQWNSALQSTCESSVSLWDSFYRQSLKERFQLLVTNSIQSHLSGLVQSFTDNCMSCETELNLGNYIWVECSGDLSSLWNRAEAEVGLGLKCRGWSPEIKALSSEFDLNLSNLWTDIVDHNTGESAEIGPFDRFSDAGAIKQHFQETLVEGLKEAVERLKGVEEREYRPCVTLLLARCLQSLPVLVQTLGVSLCERDSGGGGRLAAVRSVLAAGSADMFWRWCGGLLQELRTSLEELHREDVFTLLPAWDTISIQESGESGEVSSIIRIPSTLSLQVASSVHRLAVALHQAYPATIPAPILVKVSRSVLEIVFEALEAVAVAKLAQNVALQMLFNARFAEMMFLSREFKEESQGTISSLVQRLEHNIDPFDLSVFSHHLESRVKRCCARELTSLCPLVSQDRVQIISSFKSTGTSQDVSNIMSLNPKPPSRFQLLPLALAQSKPEQSRIISRADKPQSLDVKKPAARGAQHRDRSPVAATAASFFGSMGSSWFGGAGGS